MAWGDKVEIKGFFKAGEFVVLPEDPKQAFELGERIGHRAGMGQEIGRVTGDRIREIAMELAVKVYGRHPTASTWNAASVTTIAAEFERYLRNGNAQPHVKGLVGEAEDQAAKIIGGFDTASGEDLRLRETERVMAGEHQRDHAIPDPMFWHRAGGYWTLRTLKYGQLEDEAGDMLGIDWQERIARDLDLPSDEVRVWRASTTYLPERATAWLAAYRTIYPRGKKRE